MRLVVDTSILIDYLRGGKTGVQLFEEGQEDIEFFLPTIVFFELFSGQSTTNPEVTDRINDFLKYFQKVDLTEKISQRAGYLYRDITKTLEVPDYIIAASALEIGASMVTLNKKHFLKVPGLNLYPLE